MVDETSAKPAPPIGKLDIKATLIAWVLIIAFGFVPSIWAFFGGGPLHAAELWIPIVLLIIAILGTIGAILVSFYVQAIPLLGTIIAYVVAGLCALFFFWGYFTSLDLNPLDLVQESISAGSSLMSGDAQPLLDSIYKYTGIDIREYGGFIEDASQAAQQAKELQDAAKSSGAVDDLIP